MPWDPVGPVPNANLEILNQKDNKGNNHPHTHTVLTLLVDYVLTALHTYPVLL